MYTMGVDIGSASSKAVILRDGVDMAAGVVIPVGTGTSGPARVLEEVLRQAGINPTDITRTVATGYGRVNFAGADEQISEITCHARGVHYLMPSTRIVIDIGGQDAKVIKLDANGNVVNFVMNEKCAAGTGRFLEVMARILETDVSSLAEIEKKSNEVVPISSTCTVFAESEVISQLSSGKSRADIVAGIHESVAKRVSGLAARVGVIPDVVMTGGVAQNAGVVGAMSRVLKIPVKVAPHSQLTGAIGAALYAYDHT